MAGKYTEDLLRDAVNGSLSWSGLCRYLDLQPAGGNISNLKRNVVKFDIDTSHFIGHIHSKGKVSRTKLHCSYYLVLGEAGASKMPSSRLRKAMIEYGFVYQCAFDECPTRFGWINGEIPFEIDHINGNNVDNRPENLRFLCAICHSQQPTSSHSWKNSKRYSLSPRVCSCGKTKSKTAYKLCGDCALEKRRDEALLRESKASSASNRSTKSRDKITWPPTTELAVMVAAQGYCATGRALGVSDNAVRKRVSPEMVRDLTMALT